jgi:Xaa-Pro aminopeptidase
VPGWLYERHDARAVFGTPSRRVRTMYNAVLKAQLAAIDAVRPGVTAAHVDRAARRVLETEGLGKEFVHSTGHGLGLEIHEGPRLGRRDKTKLAPAWRLQLNLAHMSAISEGFASKTPCW